MLGTWLYLMADGISACHWHVLWGSKGRKYQHYPFERGLYNVNFDSMEYAWGNGKGGIYVSFWEKGINIHFLLSEMYHFEIIDMERKFEQLPFQRGFYGVRFCSILLRKRKGNYQCWILRKGYLILICTQWVNYNRWVTCTI